MTDYTKEAQMGYEQFARWLRDEPYCKRVDALKARDTAIRADQARRGVEVALELPPNALARDAASAILRRADIGKEKGDD